MLIFQFRSSTEKKGLYLLTQKEEKPREESCDPSRLTLRHPKMVSDQRYPFFYF